MVSVVCFFFFFHACSATGFGFLLKRKWMQLFIHLQFEPAWETIHAFLWLFISLSSWGDLTDEVQLTIRQLVYCKGAFHKESWLFLLLWAPIWCVHMSPLFFAGHRVKGCNFEGRLHRNYDRAVFFKTKSLVKVEDRIYSYTCMLTHKHTSLSCTCSDSKLSLDIIILCMKK